MKRILLSAALLAWLFSPRPLAADMYVSCPATVGNTCADAANACDFTTLWTKTRTTNQIVRLVGTSDTGDGHWTGANCMLIVAAAAPVPTLTRSAGSGTATAGSKKLAYTWVISGKETSPTELSNAVTLSTNDRITISGVHAGPTSSIYPGGTTARIIYSTKAGGTTLFKLPAGCQTPFNNNTTTSATCDPGPDSGFGVTPIDWNGHPGDVVTFTSSYTDNNTIPIWIDGQSIRRVAQLFNISYWNVNGVLFTNSGPSQGSVLELSGNTDETSGAHHNTLTNFIAANAPATQNNPVATNVYGSYSNVYDTYGTFGTGRKQFSNFVNNYSNQGINIWRNGVGAWDGTQVCDPKSIGPGAYYAGNMKLIDFRGFWPGSAIPASYHLLSSGCNVTNASSCTVCSVCPSGNPPGSCGLSPFTGHQIFDDGDPAQASIQSHHSTAARPNDTNINVNIFGALLILRPQDYAQMYSQARIGDYGGLTLKDMVTFASATGPATTGGYPLASVPTYTAHTWGFQLLACSYCVTSGNTITDSTSIGGLGDSIAGGATGWTQTRRVHLADASTFKWDGSSGASTANICYRHNDDGTRSSTPLWPWTLATAWNRARYLLGYPSLDPQTEAALYLGAIPAACDASAGGPTPTPSPTLTPTYTPSATYTPSSTNTPTYTPSATPTGAATATPTSTPTNTPTPAAMVQHKHACNNLVCTHRHANGRPPHTHFLCPCDGAPWRTQ